MSWHNVFDEEIVVDRGGARVCPDKVSDVPDRVSSNKTYSHSFHFSGTYSTSWLSYSFFRY